MGNIAVIIIGLGSGTVVAGAVFAFIVKIGIVMRLAQKTKTANKITLYEEALIVGGIFGSVISMLNFNVNIGITLMALVGLLAGIFYGCLAVSLAETLNVIPIMTRRVNLKRGLPLIMICLALGKTIGSLMYFLIPGFFNPQ